MSSGANTPPTSELERLIKVKGLPAEPIVIEADASERSALAKRFGLPGIDSLLAQVDVEQRGTTIRASGTLKAAIRQSCAISSEDFPAQIEEALDLRFVEAGTPNPAVDEEGEIEVELEADDCDEIDYSGEAFDLGEAVAQTLGLAIDPYAEGPSADEARAKAGIVKEGEQEGPLAEMLKGLSKG
jgi:hypothetical protein